MIINNNFLGNIDDNIAGWSLKIGSALSFEYKRRSISKNIKVVERRPGKGKVWLTNNVEMVKDKPTSSFVKLMGMVDAMNGVVVRQDDPFTHIFPNVDLQIHLYRIPNGKYLGLEVNQQYGKKGIGLTSAVLHDEEGPFGHAEQILTVRRTS